RSSGAPPVRPRPDHIHESSRALLERPFVILGVRGDPRATAFQSALARAGLKAAHLVDYRDVCARPGEVAQRMPREAVLRIESPGRDFDVARSLLAAGVSPCRAEGEPFITAEEVAALPQEKGRILEPRQAFRGLGALLDHVSAALPDRPD